MEKRTETRDQAIVRLATQARERGVQIFRYPHTSEWFASSISNPGQLHRVTLISCDCTGFFRFGRCMHHSALLDQLGLLPEDPEPEPLSSTVGINTPAPVELHAVIDARAEVVRLSNDPKSTQDWRRLQNAQARLNELTTPYVAAIAA